MKKAFRLAIFASGSGTNAENIINYFALNEAIEVVCVCYNRKNAGVKNRAEKLGVETQYISKKWFDNSELLFGYLKSKKVNGIILAGFLKLVPRNIIQAYSGSILNIHPALLPKFGGKGMYGMHVHKAVVANNEKETGITIHVVNEEYDKGEVIYQKKFKVEEEDDAETVADKIRVIEHKYFPKVIEQYFLVNKFEEL